MKKFIVCYNDDNHSVRYWFDKEYLGSDDEPLDLLTAMYGYGLEDDSYNPYEIETSSIYYFDLIEVLEEEQAEVLHNYLSRVDAIDTKVWNKLIAEDYTGAINIIQEN